MKIVMCPPVHYAINYEINPWMRISNAISPTVATLQWERLYTIFRRLKVNVLTVPPRKGSPDMVFTANAGVVHHKIFIPSHFRYPERRAETAEFTRFFKQHGYTIADVTRGHYFEGEGDLLPYRGVLFGGFRYRSELSAHEKAGRLLEKPVIGLELVQPYFYHLDTCLFPMDEHTVVYYPRAFTATGRNRLKRVVKNLIPVEKDDADRFACNAFRVGRKIVMNLVSRALKARFKKCGYDAIETPTSEFVKAGGSVKCLLLRL